MLSQINFNLVRHFGVKTVAGISGVAFALIMIFGTVATVHSQGTTSGGFKGVVRDRGTGNPIPGATVVLKNKNFGTQSTAITDDNGNYLKTSLPPGEYDIEVSANGYVTQTKVQTLYAMANYTVEPDPFDLVAVQAVVTPTPVTVDPGTPVTVATPKPVDPVAQQDDGDGESISMDSRRVGIFGRDLVTGLPLGSSTLTRTFDELAFLVLGVNPPPQAIGNTVGPGVGGGVGTSGQFSVNGLRSRANNFTVDGSDNNDEDIGVRRQGFFSLVPQPIESIQEYQITTLLAPAEFGRNFGAQVNALSRSGGNRFHGTFFGFLNSDQLNARNSFDNEDGTAGNVALTGRNAFTGAAVPVEIDRARVQVSNPAGSQRDGLTLLQGGAAFGGRLVRDRLFFFVSGEAQEMDGTQERHFAVPTIEQRGLFGRGATGLCLSLNLNPCPAGQQLFTTSLGGDFVFSMFPFPNDPTGIYQRNTYTQSLSTDAKGLILSGKIDYNLAMRSRPQTLTARYNFTDDERDLTDVGGALFSSIRPLVQNNNFSTYLNGGLTDSVSNEFRFSFGRTEIEFEELRDTTGFLRPVARTFRDPRDSRFLLNARVLGNYTLPNANVTQCNPGVVCYLTTTASPNMEVPPTTEFSDLGLIGQMIVSGFSPVGVDVFNFPQERTNTTFQIADTVRWQYGSHGVAFGTDIRRTQLQSNLPRNSRPLVTFNGSLDLSPATQNPTFFASPADLAAAGGPTGFFQSLVLPGSDARIDLKYYQLNFFVQDDWRISPRINLSMGLRYEYNTTPREADRKIENAFGQPLPPRVAAFSRFVDGRTKIFESDSNNVAPRFGIAASLTPKTVLRAGFGLYWDQILGSVVSQSRNVFPTFTTINFGGGLPSGGDLTLNLFNPLFAGINQTPIISSGTLNTLNPTFVSGSAPSNLFLNTIFNNFPFSAGTPFGATLPTKELEMPLAYQYTFGVEREFFRNTFISTAYVGTTGRNLLRSTTPNLGSNYLVTVLEYVAAGPVPVVRADSRDPARPVADIGPISRFEATGRSLYHSLQVGLRGRLSRNFQYSMNYAYGKAEDDVSDVFDLAGASALPQNSLTFAGEYAPANFDVRHRFTYNFNYQTPSLHDRSGIVRGLFGGWQIAGTGKFNTGQPFTVNSIFDINRDGNLTDRLNTTTFITPTDDRRAPLALSCSTTAQCQQMLAGFFEDGAVGRNSFRAGSVLDLDLALSRKFEIVEGQNIQFRVDFFNFINRDNYGVPVRFLEAPGFGRAVETVTPGRRIQFGLKYNF